MKFKPETRRTRDSNPRPSDPVRYATLQTALLRTENRRPERRGAGHGCRQIFTPYAEDRLGFVKNGKGIVERKFAIIRDEEPLVFPNDGRDTTRRKQAI